MVSKKEKAQPKDKPKAKTVDLELSESAKDAMPASLPKEPVEAKTSKGKKAPRAKAPKKDPKPKIENKRVAHVVRLSKTALKFHQEALPSVDLVVAAFSEGKIEEQEAVESINTIVQNARKS